MHQIPTHSLAATGPKFWARLMERGLVVLNAPTAAAWSMRRA